jgi:2-keto-4-pentenoate hydratase/2-oxohepta-3-ene-1,7-dioic acid hydratase in catechol pathway
MIDGEGRLRDLSKVVKDITAETLSPALITRLRKLKVGSLKPVKGRPRLGPPVGGIRKFIAVGLNYADHARESGAQVPREPILFTKAISCIVGPNDNVMLPRDSRKTDWEVELGVVIGRTARYVSEASALDYVAGYCVSNDVSEREYQLERGSQWDKGKGADTFGPLGPWLVTRDEVPDPQKLRLWLDINGQRQQNSTTGQMIFGVATLVSYISQFITLWPGDVIATGTPSGVGMGQKPAPRYLVAGDVVRLGVEGLGEQQQKVVAAKR